MTTKTADPKRATKPKPLTAQEFQRIAFDIVEELNLAATVKKVDFSPRLFAVFGNQERDLVVSFDGLPSPTTDPLSLRFTLLAFGQAEAAANLSDVLGIFLLYEEAGDPILIGKTPTGLSLTAKPARRAPRVLVVGDCVEGDPVAGHHPLDAFLIAADPKRKGEAIKLIGDCIVELRPGDEAKALAGLTAKKKGFQIFRTYERQGQS